MDDDDQDAAIRVREATDTAEEESVVDSSAEVDDVEEDEAEDDVDPVMIKIEDALDPAVQDLETVKAALKEARNTEFMFHVRQPAIPQRVQGSPLTTGCF